MDILFLGFALECLRQKTAFLSKRLSQVHGSIFNDFYKEGLTRRNSTSTSFRILGVA